MSIEKGWNPICSDIGHVPNMTMRYDSEIWLCEIRQWDSESDFKHGCLSGWYEYFKWTIDVILWGFDVF